MGEEGKLELGNKGIRDSGIFGKAVMQINIVIPFFGFLTL